MRTQVRARTSSDGIPEFVTRAPLSARAAADAANTGAIHESAAQTRRTIGWRAPTTFPNDILGNLTTLRDRSRAAIRNDGYAKRIINTLVSNMIGTGVKPLSKATNAAFRKALQALWLQWTDFSDADGLLDFYGQQAQAARSWLSGGEAFIRIRPRLAEDGLPVPMQIQVLEPELCPHAYNSIVPGGRIRAGIEFNGIGKRVAYWFYPSRPGDLQDLDTSLLKRVPAESVIHLYDPLRPGQLRGLPHLTQALITLHELDKMDDAVLLRHELANLFVGFVTRTPSTADPVIDPLTGLTQQTDADGTPMVPLAPGIFQELAPGEDVKFSAPPTADNGYADFMKQQLRRVAAATDVPYEVITGDLSTVNDRSVRVILHEFRRQLLAWQHEIIAFQLCRRVWSAFMDRVFLSGALPIPADYLTNPEPYAAVKWIPQGWPYINPVQDVQAQKDAIRDGFTSRSAVVSQQGEDSEAIDAEQAADNERADALDLSYDSDGRKADTTTGRVDPAAEPAPNPTPAQTGASA